MKFLCKEIYFTSCKWSYKNKLFISEQIDANLELVKNNECQLRFRHEIRISRLSDIPIMALRPRSIGNICMSRIPGLSDEWRSQLALFIGKAWDGNCYIQCLRYAINFATTNCIGNFVKWILALLLLGDFDLCIRYHRAWK